MERAVGRFLALLVLAVAAAVAVAPAQAATLLGDTQVEKSAVRYADGTAIAVPTTATLSRTLGRISIFVDRGSAADRIVVGLYADDAGAPGMLLSEGTIGSPVGDAWNIARVTPTDVGAGQSYWIAALSPLGHGALRIRQQADHDAVPVATSKSRTLSDLPLSWGSGKASRGGPVSAFGSEGPVLSVPPTPPAFDAQERGAASPAQLVQVSNAGDGLLGWLVSSDAPWLSLLPIFGLGSGTVSVAVVPGTLAAGTYHGTVTVVAPF